MTKLRFIRNLIGAVLLVGVGFLVWFDYDFHESMKTDFWNRDGKPDAKAMNRHTDGNYPDSIFRVVEVGNSSRANGDGEELAIFCFPPTDVPRMKAWLGHSVEWTAGFPELVGWRWHIEQNAPRDLVIDQTARPEDFIHLPTSPTSGHCTLIDVVRGVSYQINIRM